MALVASVSTVIWRRHGEFLCWIDLGEFCWIAIPSLPSSMSMIMCTWGTCLPSTAPATNEASFPSSPPLPVNHVAISCLRSPPPHPSSRRRLLSLPQSPSHFLAPSLQQSLLCFHLSARAVCDCERGEWGRSSYRQDHLPFCLSGHREETERSRVGFPPRRRRLTCCSFPLSFLVNCAK